MIRVLIVDDHAIVRQGFRQILAELPGLATIGEAASGQEALAQVREGGWDVVVLDLSLPDLNGLDLLKQVKAEQPQLPILVLTMHAEEQYAVRVLKAGASGYLTKESAPAELIAAVRKVAQGGRYISATLAERLAVDLVADHGGPPHAALSDREFQVLCLIARGRTMTEIATELCLSVKTISTHRARILQKMGMRNNAQLIGYALHNKLV